MNKKTFENLMIAVIAAILLVLSFLNKEEYSAIALSPLILLFLSGKLYFRNSNTGK